MMIDIYGELWSAICAIRPIHKERAGLGSWFDVGIARVRFESDGCWVPDPEEKGAILFGVFDGPDPLWSDLFDVIAWQPTDNRLASRCGLAICLGSIDPMLRHDQPLEIYRSPRSWRGDWDGGAVIVDWERAAPILLQSRRPIIAEDIEHGEEVQKRLRQFRKRIIPPMPAIGIPASRIAA
jgi:hypothetical protein